MTDPTAPQWFLSVGERGNAASQLGRAPRRGWSEGNAVTALVDGACYFELLHECLEALRSGDQLGFVDWRGDHEQTLREGGPSLGDHIVRLAECGVEVRGLLWRSHPRMFGFQEEQESELAEIADGVGGQVLLDERVRRGGSHHQKLVVLRHPDRPDEDVAFVGGIDLCRGRRDDGAHLGDPQALPLDPRYGDRPPWHDVQAQVRGPAIADLFETFRERWNDRTPLEHRSSPVARVRVRRVGEPTRPEPIGGMEPDAGRPGSHAVQVLRTYPWKRPRYPFAPDGERSIARFYRKAFARARSSIYVEDQYLWSGEVAHVFAEALRRSPELRIIIVVPRYPDRDGVISGPAHEVGQEEALTSLRQAGGDRVAVYDLENGLGAPIYLHAKVVIVDDVVAVIGSDNMNRRSWTHDSELSIAVLDARHDGRAPTDPGGRGDMARAFARELRLRLWREHLGEVDEDALLDPLTGFERWRSRAEALEAWHRGEDHGPRPPGRVRPHTPEPIARWRRYLVSPLYAIVIDPDGRPSAMRRAGEF